MTPMRLLLVVVLLSAAAMPAGAQTLDKARTSGVLTLGYVDGAAPFSFVDGKGEPQGYSVALCRAVAEGIAAQLARPLETHWVKLTIQNRVDAVRRGQVDLECSTTTWTLSRQALVDFSLLTFVDGGSLLVGTQSGIGQLGDLEGKRIAVIRATTTEKALHAALVRYAVNAELVGVDGREDGLSLLDQGQVDAFASDRTALIVAAAASGVARGAYKLLDQDFSTEQYALALPRGDHEFRLAVNRELARIYRTGRIERIYADWLGPLGPPSLLLTATYFIQALSE